MPIFDSLQGKPRGTGGEEKQTIAADEGYHILSNARRRAVLRYMFEQEEEQYDLGTVAEEIAAVEYGETVSSLTGEQRKRVYVGLYQAHLPLLHEHDVITYDRPRGTFTPASQLPVFEPFVGDALEEGRDVLAPPEQSVSVREAASTLYRTVRQYWTSP